MLDNIPRPIVWWNVVVLVAGAAAVIATANVEFAFYLAALVTITFGVLILHRRVGLSTGVLTALSLWSAAHLIGGLVPVPRGWPYHGDTPVMYSAWILPEVIKYDNIVHAFGFGTCVVVCHQSIRSVVGHAADHPGVVALCVLAACGLGGVNEIVEFVATRISPKTNVGGYVNTALDLVANAVGAVTVGGYLVRWGSGRRPNPGR